jgi:hypothetical protein
MGYKEAGSLFAVFFLAVMVGIFTNYIASQIRIVGGIEGFMSGGAADTVTKKDVQNIKSFLKYISFDTIKNEMRINAPGGLFVDNEVNITDKDSVTLSHKHGNHTYNLGPWSVHYK